MNNNHTQLEQTVKTHSSVERIQSDSIKKVLENLDSVLKQNELPYFDFLYLDLKGVEIALEHELSVIDKVDKSPYKTEFEPTSDKRSFFKKMIENMTPRGSVLLVSVALPYPDHKVKTEVGMGYVDGSSWFYDYHSVLKTRLQKTLEALDLGLNISIITKNFFVDTSDFMDRELAFLCGLGRYGKNHMLIHSQLGTQFHIGHFYIVFNDTAGEMTKIPPVEQKRFYEGCDHCNRCIKACPSGICGLEQMNRLKCISYLTQTKRPLSENEMKLMKNRFYGCDYCQKVCPSNKYTKDGMIDLKAITHWGTLPFEGMDPVAILTMSQKKFKLLYGEMGFAWRGLKVFKRNALIIIGNSGHPEYESILKEMSQYQQDPFLKPYYDYAIQGISPDKI